MVEQLQLRTVRYGHPDAVALTALAQQYYVALYGTPDEAPVAEADFAPPAGDFLVCYAAVEGLEVPVAMGGWRFSDVENTGGRRPAELKRMFVRDDVRGRGVARRTLAALEDSAARAGADQMVLETGSLQADAIALYRSSGYHDVPKFGHYADSDLTVTLGKPLLG